VMFLLRELMACTGITLESLMAVGGRTVEVDGF
jgi:hypothetical protein